VLASHTALMSEPHYALDENGYVHVLSKDSTKDWVESLKDEELFCGKQYFYNVSNESFHFPAIDFALPPKK